MSLPIGKLTPTDYKRNRIIDSYLPCYPQVRSVPSKIKSLDRSGMKASHFLVIKTVEVKKSLQPERLSVRTKFTYPIGSIKLPSRIIAIELLDCGQLACAARHTEAQNVVQIHRSDRQE
jgi:hypothetical protein